MGVVWSVWSRGARVVFFVALCFFASAMGEVRPALAREAPESFAPLVKKVSPCVVNISTVKILKGRGQTGQPFGGPPGAEDPLRDFFDRFFKDQMPKGHKQQSLGSGFILDREGHILTNNHVVEMTDEIKVKLFSGREYTAKVIGRDAKTDLALIRIDASEALTPVNLGDSENLEVGDWVVAIGNPFGLGNSVTAGIVSAKYRHIGQGSYDNFIQTDASINPGNSGGPLLNGAGEVIGINSAIFSQTGGNIGIGFAIPINMAKEILPQLKKGKVVRGWLGVMIQKVTPELKEKLKLKDDKGALVADVTPGGPADKAGIRRGDVIVSFDGKELNERSELPYLVAMTQVNREVSVDVLRKGERKSFLVKLGELKDDKRSEIQVEGEAQDLGLTVRDITPELARRLGVSETSGVVVVEVEPGSAGAEAGVRQGDLILELDQNPVKTVDDYHDKVSQYKKDDTILLLLKRGGTTLFVTVEVE